MSEETCENCGSTEVGDLDCESCEGESGNDDCENCNGHGYLDGWRECFKCGETWQPD